MIKTKLIMTIVLKEISELLHVEDSGVIFIDSDHEYNWEIEYDKYNNAIIKITERI